MRGLFDNEKRIISEFMIENFDYSAGAADACAIVKIRAFVC